MPSPDRTGSKEPIAHRDGGHKDQTTVQDAKPVESVADIHHHASGTFSDGAATSRIQPTNGTAIPETLHDRHGAADGQLSPDTKLKILKEETRNSKHMSKILKSEGKSQTLVLNTAIKDLDHLQAIQKQIAKDESRALKAHTKAVKAEQFASQALHKAKTALAHATTELESATQNLESTRERARLHTEALKIKNLEVEQATRQKAVDDRERAVKLADIKDAGN